MIIVRATKDLPAGAELTFWYQPPAVDDYDERQKRFKNWDFQCDCIMCQDDKSTDQDVLTKRKSLRVEMKNCFHSPMGVNAADIERTLAKIAEVPRLGLWDALLVLAQRYAFLGQFDKAIDAAIRALESLGYVIEGGKLPLTVGKPLVIKKWGLMQDHLAQCWLLLAKVYQVIAPNLEQQAEAYAKISYKICGGEDKTFNETKDSISIL